MEEVMFGNIHFFPRQTLIGSLEGTTYYSDVFNVVGAADISSLLEVYETLGAGVGWTLDIESSTDGAVWAVVGSHTPNIATERITVSGFHEYVRAKLTITGANTAVTFRHVGQSLGRT